MLDKIYITTATDFDFSYYKPKVEVEKITCKLFTSWKLVFGTRPNTCTFKEREWIHNSNTDSLSNTIPVFIQANIFCVYLSVCFSEVLFNIIIFSLSRYSFKKKKKKRKILKCFQIINISKANVQSTHAQNSQADAIASPFIINTPHFFAAGVSHYFIYLYI